MKVTMVIPSYWARESNVGYREGDAIYDIPLLWIMKAHYLEQYRV